MKIKSLLATGAFAFAAAPAIAGPAYFSWGGFASMSLSGPSNPYGQIHFDADYELDPVVVELFGYVDSFGNYSGGVALGYSFSPNLVASIETAFAGGGIDNYDVRLTWSDDQTIWAAQASSSGPGAYYNVFWGHNFSDEDYAIASLGGSTNGSELSLMLGGGTNYGRFDLDAVAGMSSLGGLMGMNLSVAYDIDGNSSIGATQIVFGDGSFGPTVLTYTRQITPTTDFSVSYMTDGLGGGLTLQINQTTGVARSPFTIQQEFLKKNQQFWFFG